MNNVFLIPIFVPDGLRDRVSDCLKKWQEVEMWQAIRRSMDDDTLFKKLWLFHHDEMSKRMMGDIGGNKHPFEPN